MQHTSTNDMAVQYRVCITAWLYVAETSVTWTHDGHVVKSYELTTVLYRPAGDCNRWYFWFLLFCRCRCGNYRWSFFILAKNVAIVTFVTFGIVMYKHEGTASPDATPFLLWLMAMGQASLFNALAILLLLSSALVVCVCVFLYQWSQIMIRCVRSSRRLTKNWKTSNCVVMWSFRTFTEIWVSLWNPKDFGKMLTHFTKWWIFRSLSNGMALFIF